MDCHHHCRCRGKVVLLYCPEHYRIVVEYRRLEIGMKEYDFYEKAADNDYGDAEAPLAIEDDDAQDLVDGIGVARHRRVG